MSELKIGLKWTQCCQRPRSQVVTGLAALNCRHAQAFSSANFQATQAALVLEWKNAGVLSYVPKLNPWLSFRCPNKHLSMTNSFYSIFTHHI